MASPAVPSGAEAEQDSKDCTELRREAVEPVSDISKLKNLHEKACDALRINRELLPIKIQYFTVYGGLSVSLAYLSVFFKQIGFSPHQIGLISGICSIIAFVCAPLWGVIADRFNIRKFVMLFSMFVWLGRYLGLYCVPMPTRSGTCPGKTDIFRDQTTLENTLDGAFLRGRGESTAGDRANGTQDCANHSSETEFTPFEITLLQQNLSWLYATDDLRNLFLVVLLVVAGLEIVGAPFTCLTETAVLHTLGRAQLEKQGHQRLWLNIGSIVVVMTTGGLLNASRRLEVVCCVELYFADYKRAAYVIAALLVVGLISSTQLKFKDTKDPERKELTEPCDNKQTDERDEKGKHDGKHDTMAVIRFFWNVHYGSWLITCFFFGVCQSLDLWFLYWHLENLGADQLMMGVDYGVRGLSEAVVCLLATKIFNLIGHIGIMYAVFVTYIVRFLVYGLVRNPWLVLPVNTLTGIATSGLWLSMNSYTAISVPHYSLATVQGILHGVYYGIGFGTGQLLGGTLVGFFGAANTFFAMAGAMLILLVLFTIAQKCSKKPEAMASDYTELDDGLE